jgi:hypothetical protein
MLLLFPDIIEMSLENGVLVTLRDLFWLIIDEFVSLPRLPAHSSLSCFSLILLGLLILIGLFYWIIWPYINGGVWDAIKLCAALPGVASSHSVIVWSLPCCYFVSMVWLLVLNKIYPSAIGIV